MRVRLALALCLCVTAITGCARSRVETLSLVADRPSTRSLWPWSGRKRIDSANRSTKLKPKRSEEATSDVADGETSKSQVEEFLSGLDPELRRLIDEELADVVPDSERRRLLLYLSTVEPSRIEALMLAKRRDRLKREQAAAERERRLVESTAPAFPEALERPEVEIEPVVPVAHESPVAEEELPASQRPAAPSLTLMGVEEEPEEPVKTASLADHSPSSADAPSSPAASELPKAEPEESHAASRFSRLKSWDPWKSWSLTRPAEPEPAAPPVEVERGRAESAASALSRLSAGMLGGSSPVAPASPAQKTQDVVPRVDLDATYVQEEIQRLIALMEGDAAQLKPGASFAEREDYIRRHAQLRMLYLIANEPQLAQQAIPGLDAGTQEFWTSMTWGLSTYFDNEAIPDPSDRMTLALTQFRQAATHLQGSARLEVHNLAFCDKIDGFGVYHPFERDVFRPGQPVLLYSEVRNFQSEASSAGYRTVLRSTIEILRNGPDGELIERKLLEPTEDVSRSPRNDYFHSYKLDLPGHLTPGPHTVRLTVEDEHSGKIATATIDFLVR